MKNIFLTALLLCTALGLRAQTITATWEFSDIDNLSACTLAADDETDASTLVSTGYTLGSNLTATQTLKSCGAESGYTGVYYDPYMVAVQPSTQVSSVTDGHCLTFTVTPTSGNKFKPTKVKFDCCRVGTDAGAVTTIVSDGTTTTTLGSTQPARNKISASTSTGYSTIEYYVNDYNVEDGTFTLSIYILNIATTKEYAFRNIIIEGEMNSEIYQASTFLSALTCQAVTSSSEASTFDLLTKAAELKNGENAHISTKMYGQPTDFVATLKDDYKDTHTATVTYDSNTATVSIKKGDDEVLTFTITFTISNIPAKGVATPLKRGLMASYSSGNLVSWRARKDDDRNLRFYLYYGTSESNINSALNSGKSITGKTNFYHSSGKTTYYYRLEVADADGNIIEQDTCKAWSSQTFYIPLSGGAPTDITSNGASYTPNDAAMCDMDGDGEYEIVLKWSPSNEKDAASTGSTSPAVFRCYKMDGTCLWTINAGHNFFTSAHTMQFIVWDFDGDGYGEFMMKTAPGTIDGEGNYVVMGDDDPTADWKNSRGKQVEGPEYITVFDGATGAELATIAYHTNYAAGESYWGDSNQNRSERYLAAIAWLDGEDANPSPIFARGYYSGAFVGAYDWDGTELSLRWLSSNTSSGKGLWGEGAHWISVADCDADGKQEIIYGSAALDHDGSLLYRTGLGHGDALHVGDFDPDNDGLEVFMVHEHSPYGMDLRDAKTGNLLLHVTASSDTGKGIMAHYNPESDGAYFEYSASSSVFDWEGSTVIETVTRSFGGLQNNRVYWDSDLADEYYDKSVIQSYNPSSNSFDRYQVNGTNYTIGTLNNSSKYNPCLLADILGDWREEIITWTVDDDANYSLVINATNYTTDYTVPHLMDNAGYRAQVISQNVCYNQPPHLDYNLRESKKLTRTLTEDPNNSGVYWDCFYTTYPVIVPDDVKAFKVTARTTDEGIDTLKYTAVKNGIRMPANTAVLYYSTQKEATWVPSSLSTTAMGSFLTGSYCDEVMPTDESAAYYEFTMGDRGPGFYRAEGNTVEHNNAYLKLTSGTFADSYVVGISLNPLLAAGVDAPEQDTQAADTYTLSGLKVSEPTQSGIYIQGGKKVVK